MAVNPFERLRDLPPGLLACPDTHNPVTIAGDHLECPATGRIFENVEGLPTLLPEGFEFTRELQDEDHFYEEDAHVSLGPAHDLAHTRAREPIREGCERLGLNADSWVAMVGAGSGSTDLRFVESFTRNIISVDISPLAVQVFLKEEPFAACLATAASLPFGDNSCDAVVLCGVLHHVAGYGGMEAYLREAHRVLKPGGGVIIADPNILYPIAVVMRCIDIPAQRIKPGWRHHVPHERPLLAATVRRSVMGAGFSEVHLMGTSFLHNKLPYPLSRVLDRWTTPLARRPFFRHFGYWIGLLGVKR